MSKILDIKARQVLDSRGNPTVEVDLYTDKGVSRASVPSGASTGSREALELRDGSDTFMGKSVNQAVNNIIEKIKPALLGMDVFNLRAIDNKMLELDGSEFKSNLGANATLAVSMAAARGGALEKGLPLYKYLFEELNCPNPIGKYSLPTPLMNIINGGEHASNNLDIQEFMIVPHMKKSFSENLRAGVEVFHHLKKVLAKKDYSTNVGDEGGFAPNLSSNEEAIEYVLKAVEAAGLKPGTDVFIAMDAASSEFYDKENKVYHFHKSDGRKLTTEQMVDYWADWTSKYPIISIEDGLDEDDWQGWESLTTKIGNKVQLVGDDLFVTNTKRLAQGIETNVGNSILIKVNQIGTLTETIEAVNMATFNNYTSIISHRSGETEDTTIADLAVGLNSGQIKTGSASRSDRIAKYNRLLRIEEELGGAARFLGKDFKFV